MQVRLALLTVLIGLAVLSAVGGAWQFFVARNGAATLGFSADAIGGRFVVSEVAETTTWAQPTQAATAGLRTGDVLLAAYAADGRGGPLNGTAGLGEVVRRTGLRPWTLVLDRTDEAGAVRTHTLTMVPVAPRRSLARTLLLGLLRLVVPLLAIGGAAFIGFARPRNDLAVLAALVLLGTAAIVNVTAFALPPGLREAAMLFAVLGFAFPWLLLVFFLRFPHRSRIDERWPWLKFVLLVPAVGQVIYYGLRTVAVSYGVAHDPLAGLGDRIGTVEATLGRIYTGQIVLTLGLAVAALVGNLRRTESPGERRRVRVLLVGTLAAFVPLIVLTLFQAFTGDAPTWAVFVAVATIWLFPASFIYVVLRDRVFGVRLILRRGLQYTLLSSGIVLVGGAIFGLTYAVAAPRIERQFPDTWTGIASGVSLLFAMAVALGIRAVYRRIMPAVDRAFFRDQYNAQRVLGALGTAAREQVEDPGRLLETVAEKVQDALHPDHVAVFLRRDAAPWVQSGNGAGAGRREDALCLIHATASGEGRWVFRNEDLEAEDAQPAPAGVLAALEAVPTAERDAFDITEAGVAWRRARGQTALALPSDAAAASFLERHNARVLVPLATRERLTGFLVLGEKLSEEPYTRDDRELLAAVAAQVAIALDNARLIGEVAERERMRRELEIAQEVQAQLFPQTRPELATLDYAGLCRAARGVGGDYFDFIVVGPGQLGIAVGDVAGKGISAALLMATLQGALRSHAPRRGTALAELLGDVNRLMCSSVSGGRFATFFYGVYDDARRTLIYANAGHNPPLVVRPARNGAPAALLRLEPTGMVVGILPEEGYTQCEVPLHPGDLIVIYTDGVTEAQRADGDQFGEERLAELATALAGRPVAEVTAEVLAAMDAFVGEAPQQDDITLIVGRVV